MSREWAIELGDIVDVLKDYEDNVFDAVCCDPPAWMYGSGFPKSLDVSKAIDKDAGHWRGRAGAVVSDNPAMSGGNYERTPKGDPVTAAAAWHGYGTALKPAYEPAVLARKPLDGTVSENVQRWGVGALAIDACRIEGVVQKGAGATGFGSREDGYVEGTGRVYQDVGRWPANVILDEEAGAALDAQTGNRPGMSGGGKHKADYEGGMFGAIDGNDKHARNDQGGASRFFYCAKAARKERDAGCDDMPVVSGGEATDREDDSPGTQSPRAGAGRNGGARNFHPTVKPIALMEYLAKLLLPPKPGVILVPFSGSGSEMIGALKAGWPAVVGIERESTYVEIAQRRLKHWAA
jgi:hypothetical protein